MYIRAFFRTYFHPNIISIFNILFCFCSLGECFPTDRVKKVDRNTSITSQQIEHQLTALLQDEKLAKRLSASLCLAANINLHEVS